jgi:trimeric autotransporter adhesin
VNPNQVTHLDGRRASCVDVPARIAWAGASILLLLVLPALAETSPLTSRLDRPVTHEPGPPPFAGSSGVAPTKRFATDPADRFWWDGFQLPIADGDVTDVIEFEGELVAAGRFTQIGGVPANRIARWNGERWRSFGDGLSSTVQVLEVYQGELIAAGSFLSTGPTFLGAVARWDGASWRSVGGIGGHVGSLTIHDARMVAGGHDLSAPGTSAASVLAWGGSQWLPLGEDPPDGPVLALASYGGDLVAAGYFDSAGAAPAVGIAAWSGTEWRPLGEGLSYPGGYRGTAHALEVHEERLIVGGSFARAGVVPSSNIAAWDGTEWTSMSLSGNDIVSALGHFGSRLIASGYFYLEGTNPPFRLAEWTGDRWRGIPAEIAEPPESMLEWRDRLVVTSSVARDGLPIGFRLAAWDGAEWTGFDPPPALNSHGLAGSGSPSDVVWAMRPFAGALVVAGGFGYAASDGEWRRANGIASWDGEDWRSLWDEDASISALGEYRGDLIAGGVFSFGSSPPIRGVGRWDGEIWHPMGNVLEGYFHAFAEFQGRLIAGGNLARSGDAALSPLFAWDGSSWTRLDTESNLWVSSLVVYNGDLVAAGQFPSIGGVAALNIARWDGAQWHPLGSGLGLGLDVNLDHVAALAIHRGELIAGGYFTLSGYPAAYGIARWDGEAWHGLPGFRYGIVETILDQDSVLTVGGRDLWIDGAEGATGLVRWDGDRWKTLGSGVGSGVYALAEYHHDLYAGGEFSAAGGKSSLRLARWLGDRFPAGLDARLQLAVDGANPFHDQVELTYTLAEAGDVEIAVFDVGGRRVATLVDGHRDRGPHWVSWNGRESSNRSVPAGIYFARASLAGSLVLTRKLVRLP